MKSGAAARERRDRREKAPACLAHGPVRDAREDRARHRLRLRLPPCDWPKAAQRPARNEPGTRPCPQNGHKYPQNGHKHPKNGHKHPQNGHKHPKNGHRCGRFFVVVGLALLAASGASHGGPAPGRGDVYAEASAGRERLITAEYFGIHFHRLAPQKQGDAVRTFWPSLNFGGLRLWDAGTRWADIAPQAGQWDFGQMDTYVSEAGTHGAAVLYTLGSTPRWASARPDEPCPYGRGCGAEPVRLAHWEEYVRRVALRYRGSIGAYELWNEPYFSDRASDRAAPSFFFSGSVADMVGMARTARQVLDAVSPAAILTTPGFVGEPVRLDLFLEGGGGAHVQAVSYHFYTRNTEQFARRIIEVRAVMRRHGVEAMPLWNTEQGIEVYPEGTPLPAGHDRLTRTQAAARMAQVLVLGAAAGLDRFYYYAWDNDRSGMVTRRGERLPAYAAMARVQAWLIGARTKGCASPAQDVVICRTERDGQDALIAWTDRPGEQSLALPPGRRVAAVEPLLTERAGPAYRVQRGALEIALGPEPVRIVLDRVPAR